MSYASTDATTFPSDAGSTERAPAAFLPRGAALSTLWLYDASDARSAAPRDDAYEAVRSEADTTDTRP